MLEYQISSTFFLFYFIFINFFFFFGGRLVHKQSINNLGWKCCIYNLNHQEVSQQDHQSALRLGRARDSCSLRTSVVAKTHWCHRYHFLKYRKSCCVPVVAFDKLSRQGGLESRQIWRQSCQVGSIGIYFARTPVMKICLEKHQPSPPTTHSKWPMKPKWQSQDQAVM